MPILTAEERIGSTLAGKYRLDRILGRGGFGVVYAGVHEFTGREVATKVLKHELGQQGAFVKRFLQEARAAAALDHPNVVNVLDLGQDPDGTVFIVLELLSGRDLSSVMESQGVLSVDDTLAYLLPVMDALAMAHDKGIVHRDLKPDNIFLSTNAKDELVPKLLDFGIAKMAGSNQTATGTGLVIGTPHYMAPEQARGLGSIGPAADVWSMAVVLWQCLTRGLPFDAQTATGVLAAILTQRAPPFATVAAEVPPELARVIDTALAHDVEGRYQDMRQFVTAIQRAGFVAGTVRADSILVSAAPSSTANTPATQHGVQPPEAHHPTGPMTPHPAPIPTPGAFTPPAYTPQGEVPPPPLRGGGMFNAVAAIAVLGVIGLAVAGAFVLWPSDAAQPPEVAGPGTQAGDPAEAQGGAAASGTETVSADTTTADTASGDTAAGDTAAADTTAADTTLSGDTRGDTASGDTASGDTASGDTETGDTETGDTSSPEVETGDTATADVDTGDTAESVSSTRAARRGRRRHRASTTPVIRPLTAGPTRSTAPRVGTQGAPILH